VVVEVWALTWHPDMPDEYKNAIVTGDARELAKRIPDESIDLIFTDPVYQNIDDYRWLAETAARVLKPDRACLVFCGTGELAEVMEAVREYLVYRWQIPLYRANQQNYMWAPCGRSKYSPLLWFDVTGDSRPISQVCDIRKVTFPDQALKDFGWSKPPSFILHYLNAFSSIGSTILDLFCGGGTVSAVCKTLGRNYVAFEIDPATADLARERVANTQPPLFVPELEQLTLDIESEKAYNGSVQAE